MEPGATHERNMCTEFLGTATERYGCLTNEVRSSMPHDPRGPFCPGNLVSGIPEPRLKSQQECNQMDADKRTGAVGSDCPSTTWRRKAWVLGNFRLYQGNPVHLDAEKSFPTGTGPGPRESSSARFEPPGAILVSTGVETLSFPPPSKHVGSGLRKAPFRVMPACLDLTRASPKAPNSGGSKQVTATEPRVPLQST